MKKKTSISLTEEAQRLLSLIAEKFGVSKSSALELIIREKAEREAIR